MQECQASSTFYQDLCYDECPQHTFAKTNADELDDGVTLSDLTASTANGGIEQNSIESTDSFTDKDDPLQAAERRRRSVSSDSSTLLLTPRHSRICVSCDKSCLRCYGPNTNQCSTCYPGSQLRKMPQTNETFCYAYVVRSAVVDISNSGNAQTEDNSRPMQYMHWSTALLLIAVIVSLVGVGVGGGIVYHRKAAKEEFYSRVALIADGDSDEEQDVELFSARINVLEYHDKPKPNVLHSDHEDEEYEEEDRAHLVPE